ncbi:DUF1617 family protein [Virgibacillus sp. CBA3643]|uniref:DUF1617 family protein n=1 Tax=Virgibacillus sp. CBA3643 TaxID=2942278 RepID=UPI0035A3760A
MKLKIKYNRLSESIDVLDKLKLKGLKSIHRTRLSKILVDKLNEVAKEQVELQKQYCDLDEEGNPIVGEDSIKDKEGYQKAMAEFVNEETVVDSGDSQVLLKSIKSSLEESDDEFSGREAYAYEHLYTAIEGNEEE